MNLPGKTPFLSITLTLLAVLAGCAPKGPGSYVVLLRDPDGHAGIVAVQSPQGEQTLTQVFKGVALDGKAAPFFVTQEQLRRDFGAAVAAQPAAPTTQPPLLFPLGVYVLPPALQEQVKDIATLFLRLTQSGRSVDLSVVGHSDSVGTREAKEKAGRDRAQNVADELVRRGVPREAIWVEAHGDRQMFNPPRPGGEPEHRRVEITIR
jgi:outer membrane protein OmpA-like peptidoglycan-associated protein